MSTCRSVWERVDAASPVPRAFLLPACPSLCSLSSKAGKCCRLHFLGRGKTCAGSQVCKSDYLQENM